MWRNFVGSMPLCSNSLAVPVPYEALVPLQPALTALTRRCEAHDNSKAEASPLIPPRIVGFDVFWMSEVWVFGGLMGLVCTALRPKP